MQIVPYGLVFELEPLPLAHYYFCGSYRDSKQKKSYRDIRQIITLYDVIEISHRPNCVGITRTSIV